MARITESGIEPTDMTGYTERLETVFRQALGSDLNLAPETPQGQLIGVLALVFSEIDELAVHVANGLNIHHAGRRQIDDYGTLLTIPRIAGELSTVTATLTGTPGTIVPAGSQAGTEAGAVFATEAMAVIGGSRSIDVFMRATEPGPLLAPADELMTIVTPIAGWAGVTNAGDAKPGRLAEADSEYRRRYHGEVAVHARDAGEAIRARVLSQPGATDCVVIDNSTEAAVTMQSVEIGSHAILVIVDGGADEDVAAAIAATRPAGTPTVGDVSVDVVHERDFAIPIHFRRVDPIRLSIAVSLRIGRQFRSDGVAVIRNNITRWFLGLWPDPGPGLFDQSGLQIGESLDLERLRTPINAVPGHSIESLTVQRISAPVIGVTVGAGGSAYSAVPTVVFDPEGAQATAAITGAVDHITVDNGGSGYTSAPTVTFDGGGGTGATATATIANGAVTAITVDNGGSGYTGVPTVTFTGGEGTGAAATAVLSGSVTGVTVTNGGVYSATPTVTLEGGGGGTGAAATATIANDAITAITVDNGGSGYTSAPTVTFDGGGGTGATATATIANGAVTAITVDSGGSGYTSAPTVAFEGGGGSGATATADAIDLSLGSPDLDERYVLDTGDIEFTILS